MCNWAWASWELRARDSWSETLATHWLLTSPGGEVWSWSLLVGVAQVGSWFALSSFPLSLPQGKVPKLALENIVPLCIPVLWRHPYPLQTHSRSPCGLKSRSLSLQPGLQDPPQLRHLPLLLLPLLHLNPPPWVSLLPPQLSGEHHFSASGP